MAGMRMTVALVAWRNLVQGGRRTLLLGVALILLTVLSLLLGGLTRGVEQTMIKAASALMSGHVNVGGFFKLEGSGSLPMVTGASSIRETVARAVPEADQIIDRLRGFGRLISEADAFYVGLSGVDIAEEARLRAVLDLARDEQGQPLGDLQGLTRPGTAVIFEGQAKRLQVTVGDQITLSAPTLRGMNNTVDLTVVAICRDVGALSNFNVFTDKGTVRGLYQLKADTTGAVQIYLSDPDQADAVRLRLTEALAAAGHELMPYSPQPFFTKFDTVAGEDWSGQRLDLSVWRDEIAFLMWILTGLGTLRLLLLAALATLVVVGIVNTMLMAVRERTREVGTLRAIGMARRRVLGMFLLEASMLGALAASLGAAIAWGIAYSVNAAQIQVPDTSFQMVLMSDRLALAITPGEVLATIIAVSLLTGLAALQPAWRAARLEPITAIHHVA